MVAPRHIARHIESLVVYRRYRQLLHASMRLAHAGYAAILLRIIVAGCCGTGGLDSQVQAKGSDFPVPFLEIKGYLREV